MSYYTLSKSLTARTATILFDKVFFYYSLSKLVCKFSSYTLPKFLLARHTTTLHYLLFFRRHIPFFRHSLLVTTPPLLGRSLRIGEYVNGVRILFLLPRNPVFTIFNPVVLYYYSTTYIPFLYQSSKIRISFL